MASSRRAEDRRRYLETRQTTKSILKAKGLSQKLAVAQALLQSGEEYGDRVKAVQQYSSDWKTASEADQAKVHWNEEWQKLKDSEHQYELVVQKAIQNVDVGDDTEVARALLEDTDTVEARRKLAQDMMLDTQSLASALKTLIKQRQPDGADRSSSDEAVAKFAQALVSTHQLYEEVSLNLDQEASEYTSQLHEARRALQAASRVVQDTSVLQELQAMRTEALQQYTVPPDAAAVLELELDMWQMEMHDKLHALDERRIRQIEEVQELHALPQETAELVNTPAYNEERGHFIDMYKICSSKQRTRVALLEELMKRLPQIPADRVRAYETWYRSCRALANRKQDINNSFKTMRTTLLEEGRNTLNKCVQVTLQSLEQQRKQAVHEQYRRELQVRLAEMRAEREVEEEQLRRELEERRQREEEAALRQEQELQQEREAKRRLIEQYHEARRELEAKQREMEAQAAAEEAEMRKQRMLTNQARLQYRQRVLEMKEQNRRQALELMEQEAAHRMAVLERLAQQVPYYERLLEAKADLSKMTAAVEAAAYQKPEAQTRGHLPLHGFDNAQVMQDSRFRLALALREAGVIQSNYAKSIIQALHPRPQAPI